MIARVAVLAGISVGAGLGALVGVLTVHHSVTGYRARGVFPGKHSAVPTALVTHAAEVLTGPTWRHVSVRALAHPPQLVATDTQPDAIAAKSATNDVLEAYAWRVAAERWSAAGTLAIGDFGTDLEQWELAPPMLVTYPVGLHRDPRGVGGRTGSLAFRCSVAGCGTWTRVFAPFRRGGSYVVRATLRAPAGRARLVLGVPGDTASSPTVSGRGWTEVAASWRPRRDELSAEVAVRTSGGGRTYAIDHVRIVDRSVPARGIARRPVIRLAAAGMPLRPSRAAGIGLGALSGALIASGGALCALLALRVRDRQGEAQQQPDA